MTEYPEKSLDETRAALHSLRREIGEMLEQELEGTGQSLETLLDPLVTVTCGFDGIVQSVSVNQARLGKLSGIEIAQSIQEAARRARFSSQLPPLSDEDKANGVTAVTKFLADYAQWKSDLFAKVYQPEITGTSENRNVTVVYAGRVLTEIRTKVGWASIASAQEIEHAIIEASQKAMATLATRRER